MVAAAESDLTVKLFGPTFQQFIKTVQRVIYSVVPEHVQCMIVLEIIHILGKLHGPSLFVFEHFFFERAPSGIDEQSFKPCSRVSLMSRAFQVKPSENKV